MAQYQHCFETLEQSDFCLNREEADTQFADWLVIYATHRDDGLFYQTNAEALEIELGRIFDADTARLLSGFSGEDIVVLAPDAPDAALVIAAAYVAEMEAAQHINLGLYHAAQVDKCGERWDDMALPDKLRMVKDHHGSVRLAMLDEPPALVMPTLMQTFE
jgi:hypothetical protein